MHVALTDQVFPRFHRRWVERLVHDGHEVLWVSEDWGNGNALRAAGVSPCVTPMPRGLSIAKIARARHAIRKAVREFRPHVVTSEQTVPGFIARTAFSRSGPPRLHIVHSWPWHDGTPKWTKRGAVRLERVASRSTSHHIVINREDYDEGIDLGLLTSERTTQLAVGIDPDQYEDVPSDERIAQARLLAGAEDRSPVFLFVGRIVQYKGIFDLLDAFADVRTRLPDAFLVVVGTPDQRAASQWTYHRFLERVRSDDSIHHIPTVDDLPALHAAADVFVMPSRYEGLGLVYIESNAMGTPTIGYDVRGVREAIQDGVTGHLVATGNIQALADTMASLGGDAEARHRLGQNGRDRWRERYNNERFAEMMVQRITMLGDEHHRD